MKSILALALALALASCATPSQDSNAMVGVEYTCAAATAALKTAITFNDKLSPSQRATVTQATIVVNPVCSQPTVPTLSTTAQAALTGALSQLTTVATAVTK